MNQPTVIESLVLEARFSSAHLYHQPLWTSEKNHEIFGKCFTEFGHGHNYLARAEWLEISELEASKIRKIFDEIISSLDHKHLNFMLSEFLNKIPTSETICQYLKEKIEAQIPFQLLSLELVETSDLGAQWKK